MVINCDVLLKSVNLNKHDIIQVPIIVRVWEVLDARELLPRRLIPRQGIRSKNNCVRSRKSQR